MSTKFLTVMPISGRGTRFADIGITVPKPLIKVGGMTLMEHALLSLAIDAKVKSEHCYFIEHADRPVFFSDDNTVPTKLLNDNMLGMGEDGALGALVSAFRETSPVGGAALSVFRGLVAGKAAGRIKGETPVAITNCDHLFGGQIGLAPTELMESGLDGVILTFPLEHAKRLGAAKWSYAIMDGTRCTSVVEKPSLKEIPDNYHPTIGVYLFKSVDYLLTGIENMFAAGNVAKVNNEFYLAPVYNYLPDAKIGISEYEVMHGLGTPEDIDLFLTTHWRRANMFVDAD